MDIHLEPIKTRKVYEEVIDQIIDLITAGELKPGQHLPPEREMAQRLGVSRPSMREAFSILQALGVIEIRPGDGSYVAGRVPASLLSPVAHSLMRTKKEIVESYEVRSVLEIEAARLAAERATPEELAELDQISQDLIETYVGGRVGPDGDTSLHMAVARMAHNDVLFQLLADTQHILLKISKVFYRVMQAGANGEAEVKASIGEFNRIVGAIKSRDPEAAAAAMRAHLDGAKPMILAEVNEEDVG